GRALLAPPPRRTLRLATTLDEETARRLALAQPGSRIGRWLSIVPRSLEATVPEQADLAIARGPVGSDTTWTLAPAAPGAQRKDWIGPFLIDRRHPLLEGLTLQGVVWSADPALVLEGVPLVSAGNAPLLVEREEGARRVFTLDLDPSRSSFAR